MCSHKYLEPTLLFDTAKSQWIRQLSTSRTPALPSTMPATRTSRAAAAAKAKATKAAKKAAAEAEAEEAKPAEAQESSQAVSATGQEEEVDELKSSETDDGQGKAEKSQPTASSSRAGKRKAEVKAGQESRPDASLEDPTTEGKAEDEDEPMEAPMPAAEKASTGDDHAEKAEEGSSHTHQKTRQSSAEEEKSADDDVEAMLQAKHTSGDDPKEAPAAAMTTGKADADAETEVQDAKPEEEQPAAEKSKENRSEDAGIPEDDTAPEPRGTRRRRTRSPSGSPKSPRRDEAENELTRPEEAEGSQDRMYSEAKNGTLGDSRDEEQGTWKRDRRERKRPRLILDETEIAGALERADRRTRRQRRGEEEDGNEDETEKERAAARAADEDVGKEQSPEAESSIAAKKSETAKPAQEERPKAGRRRAPGGMLGLLNSTLSKARAENDKRNSGDAVSDSMGTATSGQDADMHWYSATGQTTSGLGIASS